MDQNVMFPILATAGVLFILYFTCYAFPRQLEKDGSGRPAKNLRARIVFAALNLLILVLTLSIVFIVAHFPSVLDLISADEGRLLESLLSLFKKEVVNPNDISLFLAGITAFFTLFAFHRWRRIEAETLRGLNNLNYVKEDHDQLKKRLKICRFVISDSRGDEGFSAFERLQHRIAPEDVGNPVLSLAVKSRKVEALLKIWRDKNWVATVPRLEVPKCEAALRAHKRRKKLASEVYECIEKIENGEAKSKKLLAIFSAMKEVEPALSDKEVGEFLPREIINHLVTFLATIYDEQLDDLASTTAKAVILSGDDANNRLNTLKSAGFSGIGNIEIFDLDRLILLTAVSIFVIALIVFCSRYIEGRFSPDRQVGPSDLLLILMIAFSITTGVIIGTVVGSMRNLAKKSTPSWTWYLSAAFIALIMHIVILQFGKFLIISITNGDSFDSEHFERTLYGGWIMPFFIVIAICLLSSVRAPWKGWRQYMLDAGCFSTVLFIPGLVVIWVLGVVYKDSITLPFSVGLRVIVALVVSLVIGIACAAIVRVVRKAALSSYVVDEYVGNAEV